MKQPEALRLADALDCYEHIGMSKAAAELRRQQAEIERLNEALAEHPAQQEQEPVAWLIAYEVCCGRKNKGSSLKKFDEVWAKCSFVSEDKDAEINASKWRNRKETPLYTSPPAQRKPWVGLTDDEILYCVELENPKAIAEEVEAKLREKNT